MTIFAIYLFAILFAKCTGVSNEFSPAKMQYYKDKVQRMFYHAYNGYLDNAYPYDELKPISCAGMDTWGSFSLSLIDALDTLIILGNYTEFERASQLVLQNVNVDANVNVSVFETNIRVIGGLISAHLLSIKMPNAQLPDGWPCNGPLLDLAERLADKLLPAFNTPTGMPYGTVNLRYGVHRHETPVTCTAGVATFLIEFGALSKLTGNPIYERVALRAMSYLRSTRSPLGLVGNHIDVKTGLWTATDSGIGAGVDSYFEYLVKGGVLFQKPELLKEFYEYAQSINKYVRHDDWFFWVSMSKGQVSMPVFQSLEAFWPGILTMLGHIDDAARIMLTYSSIIKQYGVPPEFYNVPNQEAVYNRHGYPLRPEMIESLMYLYRATRDSLYLNIAADMIEVIEHSTKTKCGFATMQNVKDHVIEDRMESFFLAETLKYLYLIFDVDNFMHNSGEKAQIIENTSGGFCTVLGGGYIFNTEAHPVDPGALYCCSQQRADDRRIINDFVDNINLLELLGLTSANKKRLYKSPADEKFDDEKLEDDEDEVSFTIEFDLADGQKGSVPVRAPIENRPYKYRSSKEGKAEKAASKELANSIVESMQKFVNDWQGLLSSTNNLDELRRRLYGARRRMLTGDVDDFDDGRQCHRNELKRLLALIHRIERPKQCANDDTIPTVQSVMPDSEHEMYTSERPIDLDDDGKHHQPSVESIRFDEYDSLHQYSRPLNELLRCPALPFLSRFTRGGFVPTKSLAAWP